MHLVFSLSLFCFTEKYHLDLTEVCDDIPSLFPSSLMYAVMLQICNTCYKWKVVPGSMCFNLACKQIMILRIWRMLYKDQFLGCFTNYLGDIRNNKYLTVFHTITASFPHIISLKWTLILHSVWIYWARSFAYFNTLIIIIPLETRPYK